MPKEKILYYQGFTIFLILNPVHFRESFYILNNFRCLAFIKAHEIYLQMRLILFLVLILSVNHCTAQFNDSTTHHIKFSPTGFINTTNSSRAYLLSNLLNFNTLKKNIALNTSASWIYGANQNALTNNDLSLHGDLNFFKPGKKLYYWTLANFDKVYSLKVNYRFQAGAGISYNFIDSPRLRINVSDGILYEKADITNETGKKIIYSIPRNSFRLLYKWSIKDRLVISGIHFYQPSLKSFDDYIIQSSSSLSVKLNQWLSFTSSLVYNKVTLTNRETLLFTYGLSLEKYF